MSKDTTATARTSRMPKKKVQMIPLAERRAEEKPISVPKEARSRNARRVSGSFALKMVMTAVTASIRAIRTTLNLLLNFSSFNMAGYCPLFNDSFILSARVAFPRKAARSSL